MQCYSMNASENILRNHQFQAAGPESPVQARRRSLRVHETAVTRASVAPILHFTCQNIRGLYERFMQLKMLIDDKTTGSPGQMPECYTS
jgi:hypothetical protein